MDKYGVKSTHEAIKNKLMDYISTVYLGKNDSLRAACMTELKDTGILYQKPYIEANHAYLSIPDGIEASNLPANVKTILREMTGRDLGVFKNPYRHQIDSLENYYAGKDLFVSTGTGSGKTECFMWPIATKLVMEQINSPDTWKIRGVRTIMLYPMNALVSDQMGRLRKMIGNGEHGFHKHKTHGCPRVHRRTGGGHLGHGPGPHADQPRPQRDGLVGAARGDRAAQRHPPAAQPAGHGHPRCDSQLKCEDPSLRSG